MCIRDSPTPEEVDISGKADKATGATTGNFAALDGEGNLTEMCIRDRAGAALLSESLSGGALVITRAVSGTGTVSYTHLCRTERS